jgi:hypothetical protein
MNLQAVVPEGEPSVAGSSVQFIVTLEVMSLDFRLAASVENSGQVHVPLEQKYSGAGADRVSEAHKPE